MPVPLYLLCIRIPESWRDGIGKSRKSKPLSAGAWAGHFTKLAICRRWWWECRRQVGEERRPRTLEAQHFLPKVLPGVVKSTVFLCEHNARVGNFFESQMLTSENHLLALLHFLKKLCFIGICIRKPRSLRSVLRIAQIKSKCKIHTYELPWCWNNCLLWVRVQISHLRWLCCLLEGDSGINSVFLLEPWNDVMSLSP